jgi:hypothetical protein
MSPSKPTVDASPDPLPTPAPSREEPSTVVLLGPQRLKPTLVRAVEALGLEGPVATITAGWQEREAEVDEMREHLGRRVMNLMLHERSDDVFARDAELWDAYRERQDRLKELQELYRIRLQAAVDAGRTLFARQGTPELLEAERHEALANVRAIDAHHLAQVRRLLADWDERWQPTKRTAVAHHRRQIARILRQTSALTVAGGHVAVLLNRMRLFNVLPLLHGLPVVAWSAGAMALAERVIVFHDSPPQGPGTAEVLEVGLGLYQGVVPLPHARRRLRLEDPHRVAILARRFAPDVCVALDEETRLWLAPGEPPRGIPGTRRLTAEGILVDVGGEAVAA